MDMKNEVRVDPTRFYLQPRVSKEIVDYLKGRWMALESNIKGKRLFIRYLGRNGPPLKTSSLSDFRDILFRYRGLKPRTIYGSINIYSHLENRDDVKNPENILLSSPVWDVDGSLEYYRDIIKVAEEILYILDKYGIKKSSYLIWSGRGIHIHIHEKAFSRELTQKHNPIDISYAVVEYIIREAYPKIKDFIYKYREHKRPLNIENKIDIQRVFTAPLSLHRLLDVVCIAMKPDDLNNFSLEWINPDKYRHNTSWRDYEEGEGDELAYKAINEVGTYLAGYSPKPTSKIRHILKEASKLHIIKGKIGRFQVMGLLQAARYYVIHRDFDKAKSFGLNRAIFYAWAKYYKPIYGASRKTIGKSNVRSTKENMMEVCGEKVTISQDGWFKIGDREQLPDDFDRNISSKINAIVPFEYAWEAAIDYVKRFPKDVLMNQRRFFREVYEPVRDNFSNIIQEYINYKRLLKK